MSTISSHFHSDGVKSRSDYKQLKPQQVSTQWFVGSFRESRRNSNKYTGEHARKKRVTRPATPLLKANKIMTQKM